jgi:hypothetical protein
MDGMLTIRASARRAFHNCRRSCASCASCAFFCLACLACTTVCRVLSSQRLDCNSSCIHGAREATSKCLAEAAGQLRVSFEY